MANPTQVDSHVTKCGNKHMLTLHVIQQCLRLKLDRSRVVTNDCADYMIVLVTENRIMIVSRLELHKSLQSCIILFDPIITLSLVITM